MTSPLDLDAVAQLKELMGEKFAQLVETYLRNAEQHVANIVDGFEQSDAQKIVDAAHPLKSSSGNMGAVGVSEVAAALEEAGKAAVRGEAEVSGLGENVEKIKALYPSTKEALQGQV